MNGLLDRQQCARNVNPVEQESHTKNTEKHMRLGKHISDLLHQHDTVILPGFGCFSTRYIPARFDSEKGVVEPPAKRAEYNPEPREGDTPLLAHMAKQESKSMEEVEAFLHRVVEEVHRNLLAGKKVELEHLGVFHMDATGNYHFAPSPEINFLDDAQGQGEVTAPGQKSPATSLASSVIHKSSEKEQPFVREEEDAQEEKKGEAAAKHAPQQNQKTEKMDETNRKSSLPPALRWVAYIIIPLIVILIILLLNIDFFFGEGGVFRWGDKPLAEEVIVYTEDPAADLISPMEEEAAEDLVIHEEEEPTTLRHDPLIPEPGRKVYYLVVGSFRSEELASSLVSELRAGGASRAGILETTPAGYHRVSYGFYYELEEAESRKESLPEALRDIAWILHR